MTWFEFAIPVILLALLVRIEAVLIGPYWALVELIPDNDSEDFKVRRSRRRALARRLLLPVITGAALELFLPGRYSPGSAVIVGVFAAILVLWPIVFNGLPIGVRARDWELIPIYLTFVGAFGAGVFLGADLGGWVNSAGGIVPVVRANFYPTLMSFVLLIFFSGVLEGASHRLTIRRDARWSDEEG